MDFRFYSSALSRASRAVAATIMIVGLLLIGFGVLIAALPEFFAYLAALVFFIAALTRSAVSARSASTRPDRTTVAPSPPSATPIARPIPRLAPVTIATLSSRRLLTAAPQWSVDPPRL